MNWINKTTADYKKEAEEAIRKHEEKRKEQLEKQTK